MRSLRTIGVVSLLTIAFMACLRDAQLVNPGGGDAVVSVVVMPNALTAHTGEIVQLDSYGINAAGDSIGVTLDWEADGGTVGVGGTFSAADAGMYHVIGRSPAYPFPSDTTTVTVTASAVSLVGISIIPLQPIVAPGKTRPFLADGVYSDSSIGPATVSWSATGGAITPEGIYTAGSTEGSFQVTAQSLDGRVAVSTGITVSAAAPTVQQVVLSPDSIQVLRNASTDFHAFARFSDGSFAPVSANYTTTSGTISGVGRLVAGSTPGTFRVIATAIDGGLADTSALVIPTTTVQSISMSPSSVALQSGSAQQFVVQAMLEDGSVAPVSADFSSTGGIVTGTGLYTAGNASGTFEVVATNAATGLADTATATISGPAATLEAVVVNPPTASLLPGDHQQFNVTGLLSDGSSVPVSATWQASGGQIDPAGRYTAPQVTGKYTVIAKAAGKADTAQVTVNNASQLQRIVLSPSSTQLVVGALQQYSVTGFLIGGGQTSVPVTYTATGGTISAGGQFSAGNAPGNYTVIAKAVGANLADTASVAVVPLPPSGTTACTNEPSGYSVISNQPFNAKPPVAPAVDNFGWNLRGTDAFRVSTDVDASAPKSGPNVLRGWFQAGAKGGSAPFRATLDFGRNYQAVYVCLFTLLDPSYTNNGNTGTKFGYILSPYQSGSQKINHYFNLTNSLGINLESYGGILNRNMRSTFNLVNHRGTWHKVEFLVVGNSLGKVDGVAKMWVDGAKVLDFNDVQYFFPSQAAAFDGITWNPTYGGGSNPVPYDMYQWVDNWYVSGK